MALTTFCINPSCWQGLPSLEFCITDYTGFFISEVTVTIVIKVRKVHTIDLLSHSPIFDTLLTNLKAVKKQTNKTTAL